MNTKFPGRRLYLLAVILLGLATISYSITSVIRFPVGWDWLILAALVILTGSFSIKVPSVSARLSVSEAFVFAGVLLFGSHIGTLIVVIDSIILTSWLRRPSRTLVRAIFNMSSGAIAISVGSHILEWMLPVEPAASAPVERLLGPVIVLALTYFSINSWLIAVAVAYDQDSSPVTIWRTHFSWLGLNYLGGASVALVLVSYTRDVLTAFGVIVPLLIVLYLTFRTSWGRIEDAHRHVTQVNELYLSTIETLAMAVDAKDQITHGHIRRVQVFAVELAKRLGISDDGHLKAIATAALLHDMGKLAIPEHILNKPGKLTSAEFDKMKRHADIGADLLSSVKFPYPVVPIVRHHHEQWNGRGYPSGISGADIPLGARILSVVDCFDALTSDRPYRPKLSIDAAFQMLRDGKGTAYDPLIVDTFIGCYDDIAPLAVQAGHEALSVIEASSPEDGMSPDPRVHTPRSDASLLNACAIEIINSSSTGDALEAAAKCLRILTPITVCAIYLYDVAADTLTCVEASGDERRLLRGTTIRVGERVTGWTAAQKRTSINSDASLDLPDLVTLFVPKLRSTISSALITDGRLVGVVTGYSPVREVFTDDHRYWFESVAVHLAFTVGGLSILAQAAPFSSRIRGD